MLNTIVAAADTVASWNGVTSDMMSEVFTEVKSLIPIVAPAVIAFLGFRKAWAFLRSAIARA
jgi:hypothetical protein